MARWEYEVVGDGWKIDAQQGTLENDRRQAVQVLNRAAEDGWELVTVEKFSEARAADNLGVTFADFFVYFFKREVL